MALATSTTKLSATSLLREMAGLSAAEMDRLACRLLVLRAAKRSQTLPAREAELLTAINRTLPPEHRAKYRRLSAKRRSATLTPAEHRELLRLSDELEMLNAQRARSLVGLAALRKTTVPALMDSLGLPSLSNG
jgi:hypothetical protein